MVGGRERRMVGCESLSVVLRTIWLAGSVKFERPYRAIKRAPTRLAGRRRGAEARVGRRAARAASARRAAALRVVVGVLAAVARRVALEDRDLVQVRADVAAHAVGAGRGAADDLQALGRRAAVGRGLVAAVLVRTGAEDVAGLADGRAPTVSAALADQVRASRAVDAAGLLAVGVRGLGAVPAVEDVALPAD